MRDARHVAIVGSAPVAVADLRRFCAGADLLICADGGGDLALQAGLRPDLVLGDMDSITPPARAQLSGAGVRFVEHPPEKDQTDVELAIDVALRYAPARITVAGALGGRRLDHTLGNLLLLALPALRDVDVRIVDATAEAYAVWVRREVHGRAGDYVSLLPLTQRVEGITTEGLRYPLRDEALVQGHTRGVSNELIDSDAWVSVTSGCLLLIHEHGMV